MNRQAKCLFQALIARSPHKRALQDHLSSTIRDQTSPVAGAPSNLPDWSEDWPLRWHTPLHYSWFVEPLKKTHDPLRALFMHCLTKEQKAGLEQLISSTPSSFHPPKPLLFFLSDYLKKEMLSEDILEEWSLTPSPLNLLLTLKRAELIHVIDLLGVHDLAADLRQIVEKTLLQKVYRALSQEQLHFLHYSLKQSMRWIPPKLGLRSWDGNKKTLNHLLHYRGLQRFSRALPDEDLSLRWHLLHRLDTGRANVIQKQLQHKQDPALTGYFKNQILHIAKRYGAET